MLSRVLKEGNLEFEVLTWPRAKVTAQVTPPPDTRVPQASDEADNLRAEIAQLISSREQKGRESYEAGFRAGETSARQSLEEEVRTAAERMARAVAEIASARADTIQRAEADTVRLAVEIARRILHRELTVDAGSLEALIRAALDKLQSQEIYRVRVHPELEKVVRSCLQRVGRSEAVEIVSDPIQPRGGAIFEISRGTLDASVDAQLREIERGLADRLEERA